MVHNGHFRYSVRKNGGDWSTPTSLNPPKATDAGTYEIWYCLYDNEDIKVDGKSGTVTTVIKKADDEITSLTLKDWTYGNNPSAPSATAKSGNKEITFTYSDAEGGEYGEYDDVVKGQAGTWYVKATVADSDNYNGASRVKSFRIRRLDVTVTVDNKTSKYKEEIKDLTYSYETEGTVKDDLQLPLMTEATATSEVGEYPIYVSYGQAEKATQKEIDENNPNYDITVTDGTYTIEPADMTLSLKQKTGSGSIKDFDGSYTEYYDTKEHRFAVFAYGPDEKKLPSAEAKVYYSTDPDFMEESTDFPVYKNATNGEVKVYYRVVAPNYTAPKTSGYFTVNIEKVLITVDGREYDDEDYPIETEYGTLETFNDSENYYEKYVTYTGFVGDESIEDVDPEGSLNFTADGYSQFSNVGTYNYTVSGDLEAENYSFTYRSGSLKVVPKPIAVVWEQDGSFDYLSDKNIYTTPYDGDAHAVTPTIKFTEEGKEGTAFSRDENRMANALIPNNNVQTDVYRDENWKWQSYKATATLRGGTTAANYVLIPETTSQRYRITPLTLKLTPNDNSVVFGEAIEDGSFSGDAFVKDEGIAVLKDVPKEGLFTYHRGEEEYIQGSNVGDPFDIEFNPDVVKGFNTPEGMRAQNYYLSKNTGKGALTVNPRVITAFTWSTPKTKVYNGTDQEVKVVSISGDANAPVPEAKWAINNLAYTNNIKKDAGDYTAVVTLTGDAASNYKIECNDKYDWSIAKVVLTVTAKDQTIYNTENFDKTAVTYSGFVNGEDASVLTTAPTVTSNYTLYAKAGKYTLTPTGGSAKNYDIVTYKKGVLTVNEKGTALVARARSTGGSTVNVAWTNVSDADRYLVYAELCGQSPMRLRRTVNKGTLTTDLYGMEKGKPYKMLVYAQKNVNGSYKTIAKSNGIHVIAGTSNATNTNPGTVTLSRYEGSMSVGSKYQIKASVSKAVPGKDFLSSGNHAHAKLLTYKSSNENVAKVSENGVVYAVGKGTCRIYVISISGVYKTMFLTVH